jgi:hypothetical protein
MNSDIAKTFDTLSKMGYPIASMNVDSFKGGTFSVPAKLTFRYINMRINRDGSYHEVRQTNE